MSTKRRPSENAEDKKEKIRARFHGDGRDDIEVIPAKPPENIFDRTVEKRIALYTRVSTDDIQQLSSSELQRNRHSDLADLYPNWRLVDVYSDEGVSGTSLEHRDEMQRMIADCEARKIDMVVTKSISRFARNTVDCVNIMRKLKALNPPVGIWFEAEGIYTLGSSGETLLTILASVAQNESYQKSEAMNWSIEMRFRRGAFMTPPSLGYDKNAEGKLVVNEEESKTVRLIFFLYLTGCSCRQIAETLTNLGRTSKKNNTQWSPESIVYILRNERYCGDVLSRKTYTPDFLTHKSKKNRNNRPQYKKKNHHDPIIPRDDYEAVQRLIKNAKYGYKGALPEIMVVPSGALMGFVSINTRWGDYGIDDYKAASASVYGKGSDLPQKPAEAESDASANNLSGVEVVRAEYFHAPYKPLAVLSNAGIGFNASCVGKCGNAPFVEILFHPWKLLLAVRPCSDEAPNAVRWVKEKDGRCHPQKISGTAFLRVLFEMCGWDTKSKYRTYGMFRRHDNQSAIVFNLREAVCLNKGVPVFPAEWDENFGVDLYRHRREQERASAVFGGLREIDVKGQPYNRPEKLNTTNVKDISREIKSLIRNMKQGKHGHEKEA